jgi:Cu+-exporting ATPase
MEERGRVEELQIEGMHCAACVQAVERALLKVEGVRSAAVDLLAERARVSHTGDVPTERLVAAVEAAGYRVGEVRPASREDAVERDLRRLREARRRALLAWALVLPILGWMVPEMVLGIMWPSPLVFHLLMVLLAAPALFVAGWPTLRAGVRAGLHLSPTMDTLITLGTGVSFVTGLVAVLAELGKAPRILDYAGVSAMIMAFHLTGRSIEASARGRASQAIKRLLTLGAKTARVLRDGAEVEVPIEAVVAGDLLVVRPGEKVPTDGVVESGESHLDESIVTGESMPVKRGPGERVIGATLNREGLLRVRATGVGEETFLAQVVRLVEEAQGTKVPIQAFADRVTAVFVPVVLGVALLTLVLWLALPGPLVALSRVASGVLPWVDPTLSPLSLALFAAVAVLVIACPCALGLATPTALMVGSGIGAENGILIRSGEAIQTMNAVTVVAFDKTGTITEGRPGVTDLVAFQGTEEELLFLAASVEVGSEHPLGEAIVAEARRRGIEPLPVEGFASAVGRGVRGRVEEEEVLLGSAGYLEEEGIALCSARGEIARLEEEAKTIVLVATRSRGLLGAVGVADRVKEGAAAAIGELSRLGLAPVLLTGDNEQTARAIARLVGIDRVVARLLPGEKVAAIERLKARGETVAMVGDGINDAPALKAANVGIALGTGTDVAIEAADVSLAAGDLAAAVRAVLLARATFRKIRQNLFWAFFYNVVAIPIAMLGLLHPLVAEAAMAFSSINVVTNSSRLRRIDLFRRRSGPPR